MERAKPREVERYGEDLELVRRLLAGDRAAFDGFGERYFAALYRFARSRLRGDGELAREIVQTALVRALAKLDTYRGQASLLTWLCSCCSNEILMHFRRRKSAPVEVGLEQQIEPAAGGSTGLGGVFESGLAHDPEAALLDGELALHVHMALDALPDRYAQALEWKYIERLPVNEIGSRLGVRPKAAESLLTRARQAFRHAYQSVQAAADATGKHNEAESS